MAQVGHRSVGADAIEHYAPEPPAQPVTEPQGVLLGAGGDPLMLGLPIFIVGSLALGFALVGVVSSAGLGTIIPVISAATAVGLFVSTFWAIFLGQSIVACIVGLFCGYWASLAVFLLGVFHGWFALPAADVVHAQELFFISWSIVFFFLFLISLRLPAVYPGIVGFVVLALVLVVLGLESPGSVSTFDHLAGIAVFIFAGLGSLAWLNVGSVAMGGPASPPLGPVLLK
jgi:hypothetical protein